MKIDNESIKDYEKSSLFELSMIQKVKTLPSV